MRKFLIIGLLSLIMPVLAGAYTVRVNDNTTIKASISSAEPTRIAVADDRIRALRGVEGAYTYQNDTVQGAVFIKPTESYQHKPFYVFISTEQNHNYVLQLTPKVGSASILVLQPRQTNNTTSPWDNSPSSETQLVQLVRTMVNGKDSDDYAMTVVNSAKNQRWNSQFNVRLLAVFDGAQFQGSVYRITNRSHQTMQLNESQFYRPGDRAIALQNDQLLPKGETLLYKVTRHG